MKDPHKRKRKMTIIAIILTMGTASICAYHYFKPKTVDEYTEYYTKEWMKVLNKKDEVAFNLNELDSETQELINQYGKFLVKVKEVRPFLDGYKVTFSVENPSQITFPNPKVKLKWNYPRKEYDPQDILDMPKEHAGDWNKKYRKEIDDWSNSFREKEFTNLKDLNKQSWTDLEFTIMPCAPEEFGHIEFSIVG